MFYDQPCTHSAACIIKPVCSAGARYLSVPVVLRKAPPHHVGHTKSFDSQQVQDHSVGESELGLEEGRFTLTKTKRTESMKESKTKFYNMKPLKTDILSSSFLSWLKTDEHECIL